MLHKGRLFRVGGSVSIRPCNRDLKLIADLVSHASDVEVAQDGLIIRQMCLIWES